MAGRRGRAREATAREPEGFGRGRFLLLLLAVFAVKALVLARFHDHPLLQPGDGLDGDAYLSLASRVASGDLFLSGDGAVPFFVSPLYIYFLAPILFVTGHSLLAVRVVQVLLGTAAAGLVFQTARRLFGDRAAWIAGLLYGLTGVVSFHEVLILQAALDPFLTATFLFLLARALARAEAPSKVYGAFAWAGVSLGLLALNRPNVLPCALVIASGVLVARRAAVRQAAGSAAALLAGVTLTVAPATLRNYSVSGELVVISSHGGLNFLVGNGPGATGVYRWLDGITPSIAGQAADAKRVAEAETERALSARDVSSFFARKASAWIEGHPAAALRLLAKKVWFVISNDEISLNFSASWYRRQSLVLRLLAVGPWLLVPLGGAGLVLALLGAGRLPGRDATIWASFVPAYALFVAVFFVATRYRLPLVAPLAAGAGGAISILLVSLRTRDKKTVLVAACVALPLFVLTLWPTGIDDGSSEEETQWVLHLIGTGDAPEAAAHLGALAKTHPTPGLLWFRAGQAWAAAGRLDDAIPALERSLAIDAHQKETEKVLSAAHERRALARAVAGDTAGALPDLEAAFALSPDDPGMALNLAAVLAEKGDRARARELALRALAARPGYEKAEALLRALK
jgi:4-amino-4-deoxy-L-arabinose transferase-like glycosyltransferase